MLSPGFTNPVTDSQACFRAVLQAMARPGTLHTVANALVPPTPLDQATATVLLTLVDAETPLWLDPASEPAASWLAFHCGAPGAALPQATFALALAPIRLDLLGAGTDEAPESGATLIWQVTALGAGKHLHLDGPGLPAPSVLAVEGLPAGFADEWAVNHARFPRGIDVILCAGNQLAALPRTLRIELG